MHKEYSADEIKAMQGLEDLTPEDNPLMFDKISYSGGIVKYVLKPMALRYAAS